MRWPRWRTPASRISRVSGVSRGTENSRGLAALSLLPQQPLFRRQLWGALRPSKRWYVGHGVGQCGRNTNLDIYETMAINVVLKNVPDLSDLEPLWRQLEAQAKASFFTSWSWIGCWLRGLAPEIKPQLLCAISDGEVVGLGVLVSHRGRRLKVVPTRCLHLHATGEPSVDDITIEHNGLLTHHRDSEDIAAAMYKYLLRRSRDWDQLVLPGLSSHPNLGSPLASDLVLKEQVKKSYIVDLQTVRQRSGDYLGLLSSNTRSQIRRALKTYEELGPLKLTEAENVETARAFLAGLKALHERHWATRGEAGVFANPSFEAFHAKLIEVNFPHGNIQLLRVQAGKHDIGYLYSFVYRGRVLFYQSGFDYQLIKNNSRPGLVAHTLSVQHNAHLGHQTYDFMAGETQYKRSLSTDEEMMVWATIHRNTRAFQLEAMLRQIKRRLAKAPIRLPEISPPAAAAKVTDPDAPPLRTTQNSTVQSKLPHMAALNMPTLDNNSPD